MIALKIIAFLIASAFLGCCLWEIRTFGTMLDGNGARWGKRETVGGAMLFAILWIVTADTLVRALWPAG